MNSLKIGLITIFALILSSCGGKEDEPPITIDPVETLDGIYIVNSGVQSTSIAGTLTVFDYITERATQNAFLTRNGIALGDVPQDVLLYGSKLYISVTGSNLIWVAKANTLEKIAAIVPENGTEQPRYLAAADGKVYVSLYSGHLARIDTLTLQIDKTIALGPNPEKIAISGNTLYAANSDGLNWGGNYANSSLSVVNLTTMTEKKFNVGVNPNYVTVDGTHVFVLCMGNYDDIPSMVKRFSNLQATDVCPGTMMGAAGGELYVIDSPFWAPEASYKVYSVSDGTYLRDMCSVLPESPCAISVEQHTGDIVILSRRVSSEGYALYEDTGMAYLYSQDGTFRTKFEIGINPTAACFRHR